MPTYEYQCDACDHNFDEFQSFSEKPLKKCPSCGKSKLRRVFGTGAAIIFKGAGFYQTDYRSESYKSAAKAEEAQAKPSGGPASNDAAKSDGKSGNTSGTAGKADTSSQTSSKSPAKSPKSGS